MTIGKNTVEAIADRIEVVLVSQIPDLNEAYKHADNDLSISIGVKIGASPDGGNSYEVNISFVKEKIKIGSKGSVSEGQEDLFGKKGEPTDLQKDVAESLKTIADAARKATEALGPKKEALGPAHSCLECEMALLNEEGVFVSCYADDGNCLYVPTAEEGTEAGQQPSNEVEKEEATRSLDEPADPLSPCRCHENCPCLMLTWDDVSVCHWTIESTIDLIPDSDGNPLRHHDCLLDEDDEENDPSSEPDATVILSQRKVDKDRLFCRTCFPQGYEFRPAGMGHCSTCDKHPVELMRIV